MIRSFHRPHRASAILVCLALIMLTSVIVVAFFSLSQSQRRIETSGVARTKAEILARSGLDYTTSRLIQEIVDPKNSEEINGVYRPWPPTEKPEKTSEKIPAVYRPKVQLKPDAEDMRNLHVPGLIKQSCGDFEPLASGISTAAPDGRKRALGPTLWNAPYFYYSQPQFTKAEQAPDWIYFGPNGPTGKPPVLGRIAFNIYQLDGLLDVNVAGFPTSLGEKPLSEKLTAINQIKANLAGADVTKVSRAGAYSVQTFVDLRSRGSDRRGTYVNETLANRDGFREAPPGDTRFVSRLDLVRCALTNKLNTNALAFITTYTRSIEAPTWMPPTGVTNLFAPALRRTNTVTITDYHLDGTKETHKRRTGDPLVPRRFPLSRLAFFEMGESEDRTAALRDYFGLVKDGPGRWRYADSHIRTLAELETLPREPNFFELLKAAILSPSLGKARSGPYASLTTARDHDADLHLLQIGANVIDSVTKGNLPTVLTFGDGRRAAGIKNLPYLSGLRFRQIVKTDAEGQIEQVDQFALPVIVNPHAVPVEPETFPAVRLRLVGGVTAATASFAGGATTVPLRSPDRDGRIITLDPAAFPRVSPVQSATGAILEAGMPSYYGGKFLAFWLATSGVLESGSAGMIGPNGGTATLEGFNVVLEYLRGTEWIVYDALIGNGQDDPSAGLGASVPWVFASNETANPAPKDESFQGLNTVFLHKPDPRSTRWGPVQGTTAAPPTELPPEPADSYGGTMQLTGDFPPIPDADTIKRDNDLKIGELKMKDVLAPKTIPARGRSRILHRLFQTTGELGYIFRGEPWKTLDFATTLSADRALLDYFTINELPPDGMVAGRISLNPFLPDALDAQLTFTRLEAGQPTVLSSGQIVQIANEVSGANRPPEQKFPGWQSPAALVGVPPAPTPTATKEQREAGVRALGTAGQTRTWNYFVDLIAEVGRLPPGANGDLTRFIPQGASRLWMHIAIDRYTAQVIDSYIEAYQE